MSTSGGTGRTSAVANLAWVLSSAGNRVLVLDGSSEPPRVRQYLARFWVAEVEPADPSTTAVRYALPDWDGYVDVVDAPDGVPPAELVESTVRPALARYDHVLVDAPVDRGDDFLPAVAEVAAVGVVCFVPMPQAIKDAAALADRVREHAPGPVDVVPLVTLFDHGYDPRARQSLDAIRAEFSRFAAPGSGSGTGSGGACEAIQLPHRPFEAFDPLLAVLVEEPGDPAGLRAQYERLADEVTGGAVTRMAPVRRSTGLRYRRAFGMGAAGEQDRVLVAHHSADRAWADWVCGVLGSAGTHAALLRGREHWLDDGDPVELLVVHSARWEGSPEQRELAALRAGRDLDVTRVRVGGNGTRKTAGGREVDLADLPGQDARARLLAGLDLVGGVDPTRAGTGFPGATPRTLLLPPRLDGFTGRERDLEALRDRLLAADGPVAVGGRSGVGKSELALEYAHRFKGDYDVVWWVPAHDHQAVMIALSRLVSRTRAEDRSVRVDAGDDAAWPLAGLGSDRGSPRWLLVYDNADAPGVLDGLLPRGPGHVLVTSSTSAPDLELGGFSARHGKRFLLDRVTDLGADDAERVAQAVDHLPLALGLAASWLVETVARERLAATATTDAVAWSVQNLLKAVADNGSQHQGVVARLVPPIVDALSRDPAGRTAVVLAELCSFLSPQGIGLRLVRSSAVVSALLAACGEDARFLRLDSWEVDRVLWLCVRFGLFQVDWGEHNSVRVHQDVQRAVIGRMSDDDREARRAQVLRALAAFAPTEAEEAEESEEGRRYRAWRYRELQKHVFPSGAVDSGDDEVRRWLVNQLRFLYTDGGTGAGRLSTRPAHDLLARWVERFGPDDPLRARLATQLANVERRLGRAGLALRLDEEAVGHQRAASGGLTDTQTLITTRGLGGDLRGAGMFAESLDEDRATWAGFRQNFGDDHPHTRSAANNLAGSLFLSGDPAAALKLEQDNFDRRLRLFGEDDPDTWWSLTRVGVYQRETGDYDRAARSLRRAAEHLHWRGSRNSPAELAAQWHLSITERLRGDPESALTRSRETWCRFKEVQGRSHPETLSCALSYALDCKATGDPARAVELSRDVVAGLRDHTRLAEDHPFVAVARLSLGSALRAAGDVEGGAVEVAAAHRVLLERLTGSHPWTQAAAVAVARLTAARGDVSSAVKQLSRVFAQCRGYLGRKHRTTDTAAHNLTVAQQPGAERDNEWRDSDVDIPQT
ncbi:FxSxx-COOH system tetratricopeptide repeat protein [Actinosynnema sp. NPDC050436]|uniref:FxSxx-COOH system tetratricopeptide repeat protein n=1 Tax=Actinosynnema sp. NPDC050436 TaxID=3155659 RepID=UPI0033F25771